MAVEGLWGNNPIFRQVLGICSTLAVTNLVLNTLVMCAALTITLSMSSLTISVLRKLTPRNIRMMVETLIIAFYEQRETPGLGAEITKSYFREQFKGLKIKDRDVPVRLMPIGTRTSEHEVHAITGATQTCTRLERIINQSLRTWRKEMGAGF